MRVDWTNKEETLLKQLWMQGYTLEAIAEKLPGRSPQAVDRKGRRLQLDVIAAPPAPPPVVELPAIDQCAWLEGERRPWVRCKNKAWNGSAWCREHWARTHIIRRNREEAA